ncbi:hypothetical protein MBLNU230_g6790t1 [Neophaeotheca triangularis]
MRLLNTDTLKLQDFLEGQVPIYAMLSHRWGRDEATYKDWLKNRAREGLSKQKILSLCTVAQNHGHDWVWVDTICIDKSSSAELSEAINSMWTWYKQSEDCYVYLSDFTRGWTLQELLAPNNVVFFNAVWEIIGYKQVHSIARELSTITNIPTRYLRSNSNIYASSIAQRMSWAANRRTTRIEDTAYSLLGLFDVNMPLLYGEGKRAFMRLQQEILKKSSDESLFAWRHPQVDALYRTGMLAPWPSAFVDSGHVVASDYGETLPVVARKPYQMTNKGLEFSAAAELVGEGFDEAYVVPLNCWEPRRIGSGNDEVMGQCEIVLTRPLGMRWAKLDHAERMNCRELGEELRFPRDSRRKAKEVLFYVHQPGL